MICFDFKINVIATHLNSLVSSYIDDSVDNIKVKKIRIYIYIYINGVHILGDII
jgi:hypothetical protein